MSRRFLEKMACRTLCNIHRSLIQYQKIVLSIFRQAKPEKKIQKPPTQCQKKNKMNWGCAEIEDSIHVVGRERTRAKKNMNSLNGIFFLSRTKGSHYPRGFGKDADMVYVAALRLIVARLFAPHVDFWRYLPHLANAPVYKGYREAGILPLRREQHAELQVSNASR